MPLLQAQFIQPNVGDHTLGIDLSILGQLILDDPVYRLGRDSQATGNLLRRAADQRTEHELLEAISVGYVLAFERGDNVLPVVTPRTAMEGSLVNPETGLLPQVEVPDRLGACFELDVGDVVVATFFTTASCGQGPPHLQAMAVLIPLVTGDFHLGNKVDIDGDPSHGPSVIRDQRRLLMHDNKRTGYDKTVRNPRPRTLKRKNLDQSLHPVTLGDVCSHGECLAAAAGQLVCQRLEAIDAPRTQPAARALRGEKPGGRLAQPAARARDDDDFSFDAIAHDSFPFHCRIRPGTA